MLLQYANYAIYIPNDESPFRQNSGRVIARLSCSTNCANHHQMRLMGDLRYCSYGIRRVLQIRTKLHF